MGFGLTALGGDERDGAFDGLISSVVGGLLGCRSSGAVDVGAGACEVAGDGTPGAADLARRLEVTERTAYRDLTDLSLMGVPVLTQSGPGGGIRLIGDWTSPVTGLTRDEVDSVLVGAPAAGDLGLSAELASAREKILAETASAFSRHILVDGLDWFMAREDPRALSTIVTALRTARGLRIVYERKGETRPRTLIPLGLVIMAGRWYLAAQPPGCRPRTYRVARRPVTADSGPHR